MVFLTKLMEMSQCVKSKLHLTLRIRRGAVKRGENEDEKKSIDHLERKKSIMITISVSDRSTQIEGAQIMDQTLHSRGD